MQVRHELRSLTSARGIAAWYVVLYHILNSAAGRLPAPVIDVLARGYLAVDFFFILSGFVIWLNGDAQSLPLPDACCDVVSIAFGIRNVADPAAALREFYRVLRPGGRVIVLEFSQPTNRVLRWLNDVYCCQIMPHTATWISRDRTGAYKYLPQSIRTFIDRTQMMQMMREAGFSDVQQFPMTFGVCVCYRGIK